MHLASAQLDRSGESPLGCTVGFWNWKRKCIVIQAKSAQVSQEQV